MIAAPFLDTATTWLGWFSIVKPSGTLKAKPRPGWKKLLPRTKPCFSLSP
jgi:hypothetical protein